MTHLKRHQSPKFWPIKRKGIIWTTRPSPGPHALENSMPLLIIVRDVLKLGSTAKEAKSIIRQGKITIDKKARKDHRFPVGLMDTLEIDDIGKRMRVEMGAHGLELKDIDAVESSKKTCRIQGKCTIKNGVSQLNLHDGRNIIVESSEYKPGDSIVISLPEQDILEHFKFEEGAPVTITGGKNIGVAGTVDKILKRETILQRNRLMVSAGDKKIETLKDFILVTGKAGGQPSEAPKETKKKTKAVK